MRILIGNEEQFNLVINKLNEIGVLGENMSIGTYIPDNYPIEDIKYFNDGKRNSFESISVGEQYECNVINYPSCFKIRNIMVSVDTKYDVKKGDVSKDVYKFEDLDKFIEDVITLIK